DMSKHMSRCLHHVGGVGRIEVNHPTGLEVLLGQAQELLRQQVCYIAAPMKGRIHQNKIKPLLGMSLEPPPTVIDHQLDLGMGEHRRHFGASANDLQVAWIDLNTDELVYRFVHRHHPCPSACAYTYLQHAFGVRVQCC